VSKKDVQSNIVYVAHLEHINDHTRNAFYISNLSWIAYPPEDGRFGIKIRHGPVTENCTISWTGADELSVELDNPEQGIAPGQIAVLYNDDICLGGGVIS
jgi:tRNA U34 2-thiouridine synthase MnmA/TrmU